MAHSGSAGGLVTVWGVTDGMGKAQGLLESGDVAGLLR
jgi:hypothetical protein